MIRGELPIQEPIPFLALDKYENILKFPEDFKFKIWDTIYVRLRLGNEPASKESTRYLVTNADDNGRIVEVSDFNKETPEMSIEVLDKAKVDFMLSIHDGEGNYFQVYKVIDTSYSFIISAIQRIPEAPNANT